MVFWIWLALNLLLMAGTALYAWRVHPFSSEWMLAGKTFSQIAFWLFFININLYFIFRVIRRSHSRKIKVVLAKTARKMMKAHIPIAVTGSALILLHAGIMIAEFATSAGSFHPKMLSGYAAFLLLILTLFAGWLRHRKASGARRKFHLAAALSFGCLALIHLLMYRY